jgi:hypothetical protein
MDTQEVASQLGTTPRVLRQFLRSPYSTFVAVGSGARYDFNERDLPTLAKRFEDWQGDGKPKPKSSTIAKPTPKSRAARQRERDQAEWEDEGPVIKLEDIRDPRVRARVRMDARAAEDKLMMLLLAKKMHVLQRGDRR